MCTLTWRDLAVGREVYFNRDELKTRSRAIPPQEFRSPTGLRSLAPIDPDAGGSWMAANEAGLLICLLNRWHEQAGPASRSRGLVVRGLSECESLSRATELLPALALGTKPFEIVLFQEKEVLGRRWTGEEVESFVPCPPLTSSSYQFEQVREAREQDFLAKKGELASYHGDLKAEATAFTVRMNRPDAQTWSRSRVILSASGIEWDYWEEFPDLRLPPVLHRTRLPRR